MKKAIYPGSFDPITFGHLDIIQRAAKICDYLYVVVADNNLKSSTFSVDERVEMIKSVTNGIKNVRIDFTNGLITEYAKTNGINAIIRGLRNIQDYENEYQLYQFNRNLNPDVETIILFPSSRNHFVSSSAIKELVYYGADISFYVPQQISEIVYKRLRNKGK